MYKKRIFVGSSYETKGYAQIIAQVLEELDCIPIVWWSIPVFKGGKYIFDNILDIVHTVDAGVFLLAEDDKLNSRGDNFATPRDNVLIEAGLFYGVRGINGVGLCVVDSPKIPSDWNGITTIRFEENQINKFKEKIKYWINNVKYVNNEKPNNVHMQARKDIHEQCSLGKRLGLCNDTYKHINYIKILNLTSNLFVNPTTAEVGHKKQDELNLSEAIHSILMNTDACIQLILPELNENILNDIQSKIANSNVGAKGAIYSAQSKLFELLTKDKVFKIALQQNRFHYFTTDICIPFAIFVVEYDNKYSFLNHVKVDLYSAALVNENERRSMIIWQNTDLENYNFFLHNFDNIRKNLSRSPSMNEMKTWSDEWRSIMKRDMKTKSWS